MLIWNLSDEQRKKLQKLLKPIWVRVSLAVALVVVCASIALIATDQGYQQSRHRGGEAATEYREADSLTVEPQQNGSYRLNYQSAEKEEVEDRFAWRTAEEWIALLTAALVAVTLLLSITTGFLWWDTRASLQEERKARRKERATALFTLRETQRANRIALDSRRPWLQVTVGMTSALQWRDNQIPLEFVFRVENVGAGPALAIRIDPRIDTSVATQKTVPQLQKDMAGPLRKAGQVDHGMMLFPGEHFTQRYLMQISEEMVAGAEHALGAMGIPDPAGTAIFPVLYGCVSYSSVHGAHPHITAFSYRFGQLTENDPERLPRGFVPRGVNIDLTQRHFIRDVWGFWAD